MVRVWPFVSSSAPVFSLVLALNLIIPSPITARTDHKPARSTRAEPIPSRLDLLSTSHQSAKRHAGAVPQELLSTPSDTLDFGYIGPDGFAVLGETWTWDHGGSDPFEGWYSTDYFLDPVNFFRRIDEASWTSETGNVVDAPILEGNASLWVGAFEQSADSMCFVSGLGYGNGWDQRAVSPVLGYTGSGNIALSFEYFNDTEPDFDYTKVLLRRLPSGVEVSLNANGFTDQIGLATNHPSAPPTGAIYSDVITPARLQGATEFQIVFEFTADSGWSDEDGEYVTEYGPFAVDQVSLSGSVTGGNVLWTFEVGLEGWTFEQPGVGDFTGIAPVSNYDIPDLCATCALSNNVVEFHDDNRKVPFGSFMEFRSAPVNVARDVGPIFPPGDRIVAIAEWDQFAQIEWNRPLGTRVGWEYYPYYCAPSDEPHWSPPIGTGNWLYTGNEPVCARYAKSITLPAGTEQVRMVHQAYAFCLNPFQECWPPYSDTNPFLDNVQLRFTPAPNAPKIAIDPGTLFQDGFSRGGLLNPNDPGNADVSRVVSSGESFVLGDSLLVRGPTPTSSTKWEARLWFRIAKESPTQPPAYVDWKTRVADGRNITGGEFTFAWMDSFGGPTTFPARDRFVSYFRDSGEDDYRPGSGEFGPGNEIFPDATFLPGTQIEYFVSANYTATPNVNYVVPDTSGGYFYEFEILPSFRNDGEALKFPCLLYVDAENGEAERIVDAALEEIGVPRDRYDYLDADQSWSAPVARGTSPSNNGATLLQLLGYRGIMVNTGSATQTMHAEDWVFLSDFLTAAACGGGSASRALILNGDAMPSLLEEGSAVLFGTFGAGLISPSYRLHSGDEGNCVRLEAAAFGEFGTEHSGGSYAYDARGNACPAAHDFAVLEASGSGVGNRVFEPVGGGSAVSYAQVVRAVDDGISKYRTVLDGVSWHHLATRGGEECPSDSASVVTAAANEIRAALEWALGSDLPVLCENPCLGGTTDVLIGTSAARFTGLLPSRPNPLRGRAAIRFSLATGGSTHVLIHDAAGRRVRTLLEGRIDPGLHEIVWDGTDDHGHRVPSGVYWTRLVACGTRSNARIVVLE